MLLTPHTFVGAVIAISVPNPFISVPLSFTMHFLGDKVPHWDFFSNVPRDERLKGWRIFAVMADLMASVGVGATFTYYALWAKGEPMMALNIFLCSVASIIPDAIEVPYIFLNMKAPVSKFIYDIQHRMQFQAKLPWGVVSQVLVVLVCSVLLLNLLR